MNTLGSDFNCFVCSLLPVEVLAGLIFVRSGEATT